MRHGKQQHRLLASIVDDPLGSSISFIVSIVSFEIFLLTKRKRPNGGDVILIRAFLSSLVVYLFSIGIRDFADASSRFSFSPMELWRDVKDTVPWFGAIFAALYAGLYARFASQWSYLANLYNQIKAAEIRLLASLEEKKPRYSFSKKMTQEKVMQTLAEWKAGFIEDAENLHLATKKSIAATIYYWLREDAVKAAYMAATPSGEERYQPLLDAVTKVTDRLGGIKGYNE